MTRLLVVMGSGETAPTMVKPHRAIFDKVGAGSAVMLDTPYGFQENADDISTRATNYFAASVGRRISVASWRSRDIDGAARERSLTSIRDASWLFAGPGSPTYALSQWRDTPIPDIIAGRLRSGGAVVFASAAALTLGSHTVPVYEIYKAGVTPDWVPGLDVLRRATGLPAVIIPHYDNAEGGHHDTRFCYLGERRLSMMESRLPDDSFVLGVDEHTAAVFDLDARTVSVLGNGTVTVRRRGRGTAYESGSNVPFDKITDPGASTSISTAFDPAPATAHAESSLTADSLRAVSAFDEASDAGDVEGCVNAILSLEQALVDWGADTEESDDREAARGRLRSMVVRLGDLAKAGQSSNDDALIDLIVTERSILRKSGDYQASDRLRKALAELGVEVRDTPTGAMWHRAQ